MTKRTTTNARLMDTGRGLDGTRQRIEALAGNLHEAVVHIRDELAAAGFPKSGGGEKVAGSGSELTPTEAAAEHTWRLSNIRENLRDGITIVQAAAKDLDRAVDALSREVAAALPQDSRERMMRQHQRMAECRDGLVGKDGSLEWGDPTCGMPATKAGLCSACYTRWYRWRQVNGIDTSRDFREAG